MSSSIVGDSFLGVDFGTITTRVALFDVVDGQYRFIGAGSAPTTLAPPYLDVGEGMRNALDQLAQATGRVFLDRDENLVVPGRADGAGVDAVVATASAGPEIRAVIAGLMPDISGESVRNLASSTYIKIVDELGLHDHRREEQQIDAILAAQPDLILIAGGTEGGACQAVLRQVEIVEMGCRLMPEERKPHVLYAGNSQIARTVQEKLIGHAKVHTVPNLRPSLEFEDLAPARAELASIFEDLRSSQLPGFAEMAQWSGQMLTPTARAFGQIVRFFSRVYEPGKGVLGADVGASTTTIAAAFEGRLHLTVRPGLGLSGEAEHAPSLLARWLPNDVPDDQILEYLYDKSLNPGTIPAEIEELYLEHAIAREVLREALLQAESSWRPYPGHRLQALRKHQQGRTSDGPGGELLPWFEPVLASGALFARAPRMGMTALTLLDGLQPTGVTTLVLDKYSLAPMLGAAANLNPVAVVQVLDSGVFINLGTVVAPVGRARPGSPILRVQMQPDSGSEVNVEVRAGTLKVLPLAPGQTARLSLRPVGGIDVGLGPGRPANLRRVLGGAVGLIVDARGRPLALSNDPARRRENQQKWLTELNGPTLATK